MSDCLFCKIVEKQIPAKLVHEDDKSVAFLDINPQAPVHVLVIPRKHISCLSESSDEDAGLLGHLQRVAAKLAEKTEIAGKGYRVVLNNGRGAGQTVDHVHYHILGGRPMQWPPG